jgi:hypothetical protein
MGTSRWGTAASGAAIFVAMVLVFIGAHGIVRWLTAIIGVAGLVLAVLALVGVGIKRL